MDDFGKPSVNFWVVVVVCVSSFYTLISFLTASSWWWNLISIFRGVSAIIVMVRCEYNVPFQFPIEKKEKKKKERKKSKWSIREMLISFSLPTYDLSVMALKWNRTKKKKRIFWYFLIEKTKFLIFPAFIFFLSFFSFLNDQLEGPIWIPDIIIIQARKLTHGRKGKSVAMMRWAIHQFQ